MVLYSNIAKLSKITSLHCISSDTSEPSRIRFSFQPENIVVNEVDFNAEFISRMIPKLEWTALVQAAQQVSIKDLCIIWEI